MTSIENRPSWTARLNPRNWTLTWKLVVVGLVPALLALTLGVLRVADQAGTAADLGRNSRLVEVREQVAGAASALRQERNDSTLFVATVRTADRAGVEAGFGQADSEIEDMVVAIRGAGELDPAAVSAMQQAETALGQLAPLRTDVLNNNAVNSSQILTRYGDIVASIDVLDRALLRQLRTPGSAGLADALTAITGVTEQLAVEHTVVGAAIRSTRLAPGDAGLISLSSNRLLSEYREYQVALTPEQLTRFGNFLDDPANAQREQLKNALLTAPDASVVVTPTQWDAAYSGSRAAADRSGELIRGELVATSTAAEERASNLAGVNSVILMLGLLAGIAIAFLVGRALIRSLRVLRTAALDVAQRRLPQAVESMRAGDTPDLTVDPVPLSGRDEVGQVARAFDAVHGQAIRLAADQASLQAGVSAMFVNLSRRSQALVERQLQLIEQLESHEQDADQLANLFQLDHLATRMRRNSENLLVLAGTDLAKRNIAPVPMVDVLRAAVSEIERYQRIVVQAPPNVTILGRAASDLVHLLAELLDNATNFSPPDSQVVMSTTRTGDGAVVVEIADRGVGMTDEELGDANSRLGGPSSVDVSTSRRMGLFVVGRLGARHGVGVRLSSSTSGGPGSGLTASVTVPAHLVPSSSPGANPVGVGKVGRAPVHAFGVPPQRGGTPDRGGITNGSGRPGSLSALVAGTDGPSSPPAPGTPTTGPERPGHSTPPAVNGSASGLPTRRPGSTLRPMEPLAPAEQQKAPDGAPTGADATRQEATGSHVERPGAGTDRTDAGPDLRKQAAASGPAGEHTPAPPESLRDGPRPEATAGNGVLSNGLPTGVAPAPLGTSDPRHENVRSDAARNEPAHQDGAEDDPAQKDAPQRAATQRDAAQRDAAQDTSREDARNATGDAAPPPPLPQRRPLRGAEPRPTPRPAAPSGVGPAQQSATDDRTLENRRTDDRSTEHRDRPVRPAAERPATATPAAAGLREGAVEPREPAARGPQFPPTTPMPVVDPQQPALQQPAAQQPTGPPSPQDPRGPRGPQPAAPRPEHHTAGPVPFDPVPFGPVPFGDVQSGRPTGPIPFTDRPAPVPAGPAPYQDGLFAPSVPVAPEPEYPAGAAGSPVPDFDPNETTPIFEEIASAWFRSNRSVPVEYGTEPDIAPEPVTPPAPMPVPHRGGVATAIPFAPPGPLRHPAAGPPEVERVSAPAAERDFVSLADEGWRAARSTTVDRGDELTSAGLPKRRPRARLVPGSAGSAVMVPPDAPTRSAESIRGRLASYQQGVRMGRESRSRGDTESTPASNGGTEHANTRGNHDEESS